MRILLSSAFAILTFVTMAQTTKGTIKIVKPTTDSIVNKGSLKLSDTLETSSGIYVIRLSSEYKSKLLPKFLNGQLVLADSKGELSESYIIKFNYGTLINGVFVELSAKDNIISSVLRNMNLKTGARIWISSIKGSSPGGVTFKNIIDGFAIDKIK